eukprot:TRINITY_DN6190_c0_g2_i3.p4 TRINITY_DN6190_c0_g2~~TRINITY_DN6190_c0_g2_i3.p4  ORF type:complete len:127 (-),score=11.05 TRINITY_DN6190_c0_g2_i3:538-918(-)
MDMNQLNGLSQWPLPVCSLLSDYLEIYSLLFFNSQNDKLMVRDGLLACVHLGVLLNIGSVIWWGTLTAQLFIRERRKEASEIILPLLWTATPIVMALMAWGCEASLRVTKAEIEELKKSTYHFKKL